MESVLDRVIKQNTENVNLLKTKDYSMGEMVKTPVFWVLLLMFIFANAAGTMMVSFTSPIAQRQVGQTAMTAAFCVSIMTLANMCGRIGFGFIYDILKGWKSLIPFYSVYIQCRIAGISKIFWIDLPVMILLLVLNWTGRNEMGVYKVLYYSNFALQTLSYGYLARAFGKKTGFCIAAAFLPVIFLPILGFGSAKYVGTKG